MKRLTVKLFALLLIFSMVLPQMVHATSYYYMTITLAGPDQYGADRRVTRTSARYLTWQDSTLATIAQAMYAENVEEEIRETYVGTGLQDKFYEFYHSAIDAITPGGDQTNWNRWVLNCVSDVDQQDLLLDVTSTLWDLEGIGSRIDAEFHRDGTNDVYTMTLELTCHYYDDGYTAKLDETTKKEQKGKVIINHPVAPAGRKITVLTYPDEGEITGYVKVLDKDGKRVKLTYIGNGKYTFVMPKCGVTVSGTFRSKPEKPEATGVASLLDTDNHVPFMIGDNNGLFRPKAEITRAEVAQMFYRLLRNKNISVTQSFRDVPSGTWYVQAVEVLASMGIIEGVGHDSFEPKRSITRAEFATICARFANQYLLGVTFPDVPETYWASEEISTAASYGWIYGGTDGNFAPKQPISREEAAAIVNRMLYRLGDQIAIDEGATKEFADVNDSMWSWYEIAEATYDHDHKQEEKFVHEYWVDEKTVSQ